MYLWFYDHVNSLALNDVIVTSRIIIIAKINEGITEVATDPEMLLVHVIYY
jgi:hypothetical protein